MAWLAQLVERTTLNRVVVGSIPTLGVCFADDSSSSKESLIFHFSFCVEEKGNKQQLRRCPQAGEKSRLSYFRTPIIM